MPSCIKSNGVSIINSVLQSRQSRQHGVSSICGDIAEVKVVTLPVEARHFLHPLSTKEVDEDIFSRAMFKEKVQSGGHLGALQSAWEHIFNSVSSLSSLQHGATSMYGGTFLLLKYLIFCAEYLVLDFLSGREIGC